MSCLSALQSFSAFQGQLEKNEIQINFLNKNPIINKTQTMPPRSAKSLNFLFFLKWTNQRSEIVVEWAGKVHTILALSKSQQSLFFIKSYNNTTSIWRCL